MSLNSNHKRSLRARIVRRTQTWVSRLFASSSPRRHENPYATLLPVLTALATKFQFERVLEFGCGFNSTLSFLNREVYPSLSELVSVENDPEWGRQLSNHVNDDRLRLILTDGKIAQAVTGDIVRNQQLILIDDSTCAADRAMTIKAVSDIAPEAIVVIHDFEVPEYRAAAIDFRQCCVCDSLRPNTAVLATKQIISTRWFKDVNRIIKKQSHYVPLNDTLKWRRLFQTL